MNKKTYDLIVGIIGGVTTIAIAIVSYFQPDNFVAINTSIGILGTAFIEIASQFYKGE